MMQRFRGVSPAFAMLCECHLNSALAACASSVSAGNGTTEIDQESQGSGAPTSSHNRAAPGGPSCFNHYHSGSLHRLQPAWGGSYSRAFHASSAASRRRGGAVSGSDSDSDLDDSFSEDDELGEEEDSVWEQYREVNEEDDDDQDEVEPSVNPRRRLIHMADALADGERESLVGPVDDEPRARSEDGGEDDSDDMDLPRGRARYEQVLDAHVKKLYDIMMQTKSKEFKKMTKKEREDFMRKAALENPPPGIDPPTMIPPGLKQLGKLLENGRWYTTFVDVKLTTKQTPQGKKQRYSVMVMVGDLNGTGGYGVGVAKEPNEATLKALRVALLNSVVIPRYRQRTVYFPQHTKFVKTEMTILPRPLEFGLVAPPVIVEACELLGLHDLTVKTHKSRNTRNVVKCFFQALCAIPTPQEISEAKGCYMREKLGSKLRAPRIVDVDESVMSG